jgi:hypothetical protein
MPRWAALGGSSATARPHCPRRRIALIEIRSGVEAGRAGSYEAWFASDKRTEPEMIPSRRRRLAMR